jgi:hypothetical protein
LRSLLRSQPQGAFMTTNPRPLAPLSLKPDLAEAARCWEAYCAGEIIDRPVVCVTAPRAGYPQGRNITYQERALGDIGTVITQALANAEATYWGGEAVPSFFPSFDPDEIAAFCGAELRCYDAH